MKIELECEHAPADEKKWEIEIDDHGVLVLRTVSDADIRQECIRFERIGARILTALRS